MPKCDGSFRWRRAQIGIHAKLFGINNCWPIRWLQMNPMSLARDRRPLNGRHPNKRYNRNRQRLDSLLSSRWPRMLSKSWGRQWRAEKWNLKKNEKWNYRFARERRILMRKIVPEKLPRICMSPLWWWNRSSLSMGRLWCICLRPLRLGSVWLKSREIEKINYLLLSVHLRFAEKSIMSEALTCRWMVCGHRISTFVAWNTLSHSGLRRNVVPHSVCCTE